MYKFLIVWCLISTALHCFASPYESLAQKGQYRKLQKRDYLVGENVQMTDTRAIDAANDAANVPGSTNANVLEALFKLLIGKEDPIVKRAANLISDISKLGYVYWKQETLRIFRDTPINTDTDQFFSLLYGEPRNYRKDVVAIVLALTPQQDGRMMDHPDQDYILNDNTYIDGTSEDLGETLLTRGEQFTYSGALPDYLVIEVLTAAVAVATGEAPAPHDIVNIITSLSDTVFNYE